MTPRPGTNVLALAPSLSQAKHDQCAELLDCDAPEDLDVLRITYSGVPSELVEEWQTDHDRLPARLGIVNVGDQAGVTDDGSGDLPSGVVVTTANPNDITGLGMRLNNYLNDLNPDRQLVVCFDSLTELLQFTDVQAAFKFLHMFTGQLRDADAVAHFHLDPNALDDQAVNRLKPVFDDAVRAE
jgi:hypothetical protein